MAEFKDREKSVTISKAPEDIETVTDNEKKEDRTKKNAIEYQIETLQLEQHLQKQIEEDKQYWLTNDAKLRAVHQGTLTYEDFRQLVASAHLKPLSKEDQDAWQKMPSRVLWNPINPKEDDENDLFKSPSTSNFAEEENSSLSCKKVLPKNTTDFSKAWKCLKSDTEKYSYLNQLLNDPLGGEEHKNSSCCPMENIFKEEVPIQIFPDIIHLLVSLANKKVDDLDELNNSINCLSILEIVSKSKRFQLTMSFLSNQDKNEISLLLKNINNNIMKLNVLEENNGTYTQEKVLILLEEVNNKYNISNQK